MEIFKREQAHTEVLTAQLVTGSPPQSVVTKKYSLLYLETASF